MGCSYSQPPPATSTFYCGRAAAWKTFYRVMALSHFAGAMKMFRLIPRRFYWRHAESLSRLLGCSLRLSLARGRRSMRPSSDRKQDAVQEGVRIGRAAGDVNVHGKDRVHAAPGRVVLAEDAAAAAARAHGHHQARFGHGGVSLAQGQFHVTGDRPGDEQHVGVTGRGDEVDAEAFEVIDRAVQSDNLNFAAVAGASIHLADVQRTTEDLAHAGFDLLTERFNRRLPRRGGFSGMRRRARRTGKYAVVRAVGLKRVGRADDQFVAMTSGAFASVGHADGVIDVGAEAAEDTLGEVEPGRAPAGQVLE